MRTGYLYCIENQINKKKYIGKTYATIETRWEQHQKDMHKYSTRPLYAALNKYGIENFTITNLGVYNEGKLEQKEKEFIELYNTYVGNSNSHGYNATLGGEGVLLYQVEEDRVVQDYLQCYNMNEVARKHSCSASVVSAILNKYDINKFSSIAQANTKDIIQDYNNGVKVSEIAKKYQVHETTIGRLLNTNQIEMTGLKLELDKTQIINDYLIYKTAYYVANKYNCSPNVIYKILEENNIPRIGNSLELDEEEIIQDYYKLQSMNKVADKHQIAKSTVSKILHKHDIVIRKKAGTAVGIEELKISFPSIGDAAQFLINKYNLTINVPTLRTQISRQLNGHQKTAQGFTYKKIVD